MALKRPSASPTPTGTVRHISFKSPSSSLSPNTTQKLPSGSPRPAATERRVRFKGAPASINPNTTPKRPSDSSILAIPERRVRFKGASTSNPQAPRLRLTTSNPPTATNRPDPKSKGAPVLPRGLSKEEWLSLSHNARKRLRGEAWIERSQSWNGFAGNWKGVKVLGSGTYGIAGLFEYTGTDGHAPKNIVVKQSARYGRAELLEESRMLEQIGGSGSVHFVRLLKAFFEEGGTGTSQRYDPSPFIVRKRGLMKYDEDSEVCRLYLEYCEGGDMFAYNKKHFNNGYADESFVWRWLDCFTKALCVLEMGQENPNLDRVDLPWKPIAHLDIKLDNIFIGAKDEEHEDPGIFKLADFGMARNVPDPLTDDFVKFACWTGADYYKAPELLFHDIPSSRIGLATNIWCMGACLHRIMTGFRLEYHLITVSREQGGHTESYRTFGKDLVDKILPYSNALKGLIMACLQYDPASRPTIKQLQRDIQEALSTINDTNFKDRTDPRFDASWSANGDLPEELDVPERSKFKAYINPRSPTSPLRGNLESVRLGSEVTSGSGDEGWRVHAWTPLLNTPSKDSDSDSDSDDESDYGTAMGGAMLDITMGT